MELFYFNSFKSKEVHLTATAARNGRLLPLDVDPDWDEEGGVSGPEAHAARQAVRADRQPQKRSHFYPYKKDKYRRKGKGRRCCLGVRIYSIPCCAKCFALDYLNYRMKCTRMI